MGRYLPIPSCRYRALQAKTGGTFWVARGRVAMEGGCGENRERPPSHHSCRLLLNATLRLTITLISSHVRKWRQPGLATGGPAFVGWHQLVGGIQGAQVHFDFVPAACENR